MNVCLRSVFNVAYRGIYHIVIGDVWRIAKLYPNCLRAFFWVLQKKAYKDLLPCHYLYYYLYTYINYSLCNILLTSVWKLIQPPPYNNVKHPETLILLITRYHILIYSPHIIMLLYIDFMKLCFTWFAGNIVFHFHCNMSWQNG